jgi:hypothetical protein
MWGTLSDKMMGLLFTVAAGPNQHIHIYCLRILVAILLHEF